MRAVGLYAPIVHVVCDVVSAHCRPGAGRPTVDKQRLTCKQTTEGHATSSDIPANSTGLTTGGSSHGQSWEGGRVVVSLLQLGGTLGEREER